MRRWTLTLAGALAPAVLLAQAVGRMPDVPADPPADSEIVEDVRVRLAQVPILVRDRAGRPVADLTLDELVVKHRGERVEAAFLDPVRSRDGGETLPAVRLKVEAPGGGAPEPVRSHGKLQYHVLYVDLENDSKVGRPAAMRKVIALLERSLTPNDRVAVISYAGEIRLEQPFSADLGEVKAGVERAYGRTTRGRLDATRRVMNLVDELRECVTESGAFVRSFDERCVRDTATSYIDRVEPLAESYLAGLDGVVRFLSGIPGRKTVIALSHGLAVEPGEELLHAARAVFGNTLEGAQLVMGLASGEGRQVDLDRVIEKAIANEVTVHFVDRNPAPTADAGARLGAPLQPGQRPAAGAWAAAQASLTEIAHGTGGILVSDVDAGRGLEKVLDLEHGGYVVGFYLPPGAPSRGKVSVSSSRRGVKVTHAKAHRVAETRKGTIGTRVSLGAPLDLGEIGAGQFVPFRVIAEPKDLGYRPRGKDVAATFTLHVRVSSAAGATLADSFHLIDHAYPRNLWEKADVLPVEIQGWMELPPGEFRIEARMTEPDTGRSGGHEERIRVPG